MQARTKIVIFRYAKNVSKREHNLNIPFTILCFLWHIPTCIILLSGDWVPYVKVLSRFEFQTGVAFFYFYTLPDNNIVIADIWQLYFTPCLIPQNHWVPYVTVLPCLNNNIIVRVHHPFCLSFSAQRATETLV